MKNGLSLFFWLLLTFCFAPLTVEAQEADTVVVRKEVDSLVQLCRGLTGKRQFEEALQVVLVAEQKAEVRFGRESAGYATCVFNKGRVFHRLGKYSEAEIWYLEAKSIQEKVVGKQHPNYAMTLSSLANFYCYAKGDYDKAEPLYIEAKSIREKVLGKENPDYAWSLQSLAALYVAKGDYEKAEPLYIEAKSIREKVLGKEHPEYAGGLNDLAVLYDAKGSYEKSEPLYIEAKSIWEKILGKEHPYYAGSLYNLANLYSVKGNYEKAEPLYIEAKSILEKVLGKENPDYANSLYNLAIFYYSKGDYEKSEPLYIEAKSIWENVLGKEHPDYAKSLSSLANLYYVNGDYSKAEPFYLEAKSIQEKVLGKEHPEYANSLNNLANLYYANGNYYKAEPLYLEAKSIQEKVLGKEHLAYAGSLNNLAVLYKVEGDYDRSEPLYWEAISIREKILGKEHSEYAESLHNLANLYYAKGDYKKATTYFLSSNSTNQALLQKSFTYSSEREQLQYAALFKERSAAFLSFTQDHPTDSLLIAAYDNALSQNNALLDAAAARERAIAQADSVTQYIYTEWKSCLFRLNKQYDLPIAERKSALVDTLEDKANQYEKELVRRSPDFVESRKMINWQQVRDHLQPGQAAIEFVSYQYYTPKGATDSILYAALVLRSGDVTPALVPLCEQKQLEAVIGNAPKTSFAELWDTYIQQVYYPQPGKSSLYDLIWKPLESYLSKTKTVFFSPDGLLHHLNLAAIRDPKGAYLGQRYQLVQLGSTRRLVQPAAIPSGKSIALFGGIRYDMDSTKIAAANAALPVGLVMRGGYSFNSDSTLRNGAWEYLPATKTEVDSIAARSTKRGFRVAKFTDYAATEEAVKQIGTRGNPSPRVLHLATHGFFFPDPKTEMHRDGLMAGEQVFRLSDDPMRRAGLVLAGANQAWSRNLGGKALSPNMEDGILTAAEIRALNLSNTELVVLSACDTGLGDVAGNEGVYGLQRALKIAGAKYIIMSLWSVPDVATQQLMDSFYINWMDKGIDIPTAFRAAQTKVKKDYPSPFYWGGFVLLQ